VARGTAGFSGADLANLVNESAIIAVMKGQEQVETADMEEARDKIRWGREKKSKAMSDEERRTVALHESGHAIVGKLLESTVDPIHKVVIVLRGMALGATMYLPKEDSYLMRRQKLLGNITIALAGRAAEEVKLGDITSGAQNDLEAASALARQMVCKWGMTEELGPIDYSEGEETLFLGREVTRARNLSEDTARKIDQAIRKIIDSCNQQAHKLLEEHCEALDKLAEALLEYEVLDGDEVATIIDGKPLNRPPAKQDQAQPAEQPEAKPAEDGPMPGLQEGIQPA
jgi:cell division protease FtsH